MSDTENELEVKKEAKKKRKLSEIVETAVEKSLREVLPTPAIERASVEAPKARSLKMSTIGSWFTDIVLAGLIVVVGILAAKNGGKNE
jgi:hypothetical protein